ncbi:hypothetical protein [Pseudotamlana agarivorans]|uniref:hypothetical protein n=1 Tax=Pseudotamlana agarivorans TaxID=481183 RepID=UPI00083100C1|nr:hypothetical protein [Tamlana agarivorans]
MKQKLFLYAFTMVSLGQLQAQDFKIAISSTLPVFDTTRHAAALDVSYVLPITDAFEVGLTSGFATWFKMPTYQLGGGLQVAKEDQASMIPVALTTRFNLVKRLDIGLDLGYAFAVNTDIAVNDGLYFAPKIQYQIFDYADIVLGYRLANFNVLISEGSQFYTVDKTMDMITVGLEFRL